MPHAFRIPLLSTIYLSPALGLVLMLGGCGEWTLVSKGYSWMSMECGVGGGYSHIQPPNKKACQWNNLAGNPHQNAKRATLIGASSGHAGGVNVGTLDGSVRFVKDSVNLSSWAALATISGGEILSSDSL